MKRRSGADGLTRRVAVTVPNFMQALTLLAETDLLAALPMHLVGMHAARLGVVAVEPPLPGRAGGIQAVATRAAMMDPGVAWLFEMVGQAGVDARCGALASRRMVEGASRTAGG